MEELFFDARGTLVSFVWLMFPWALLFIGALVGIRDYERFRGFSRKARLVWVFLISAIYIGFLWSRSWTNFFIIQVSPNRSQVVLVYFIPERTVVLKKESIRSIEAAHKWDSPHYTGANRKRLFITTQTGKTYYSGQTSPQWAEKQEKRLKDLLEKG